MTKSNIEALYENERKRMANNTIFYSDLLTAYNITSIFVGSIVRTSEVSGGEMTWRQQNYIYIE